VSHTAETCTIATHDHFGQRQAFENGTGLEPLPDSDELLCGGLMPAEGPGWMPCGRRIYYDYADENYHHLDRQGLACSLIPAEIDGEFQPSPMRGPSSR
jgi:hypothetical protein